MYQVPKNAEFTKDAKRCASQMCWQHSACCPPGRLSDAAAQMTLPSHILHVTPSQIATAAATALPLGRSDLLCRLLR